MSSSPDSRMSEQKSGRKRRIVSQSRSSLTSWRTFLFRYHKTSTLYLSFYILVLMQIDILFVRPGEWNGNRGDVRRGGHGRGRHHWLSRVHGQSSIGLTFFEAQRIEGKSNYNLMLVIKNGMMYHDQGSTKNQNVFMVLSISLSLLMGALHFRFLEAPPWGGGGPAGWD